MDHAGLECIERKLLAPELCNFTRHAGYSCSLNIILQSLAKSISTELVTKFICPIYFLKKKDYSKFLDEDFDVKDWVNNAFQAQKEGTKDQYATTLVMKLQMFIQEVNNVIEDSCQQAITNLPRVMRELEAVRQEAALLQEQMRMVKHDIKKVEQDTAHSMQTLLKLDNIKSRMKAASDALQEADNWTTLSADVDQVFESGDVHAISEKLVGMQQSLQMLTDVPDYAERCQFLETLKNRLEAMLSTQVVAAFSAQSLESAQMYVRIFEDIDRLPQLYKYYHKCQKGDLIDQWRKVQTEKPDASLVEWLTSFYDLLLTTWHTQIQWCAQVFTDPVPIVSDLLTETLTGLDPSVPSCIASDLQSAENALMTLIDLKESSERFAKNVESAIHTHSKGSTHSLYAERLAATIYSPYKPYVAQYETFEQSTLTAALNDIPLDQPEVLDTVNLLSESVAKLFAVATQANERCCQLTNGCGYVGLISAIQTYLKEYDQQFRRVLTNLREKCKIGSSTLDSEDWSIFQNALRLIQICGNLLLHTEELDQNLVSSIVTTVGKYCPPTPSHDSPSKHDFHKSAFEDYKSLLLEGNDKRRGLEALITRLEDGDTPSVLDEIKEEMYTLSEMVHQFAFDIVFTPLQQQIGVVAHLEIWTSGSARDALTSDLPTFSLTPQEYITKIGQYLMTIPQQLEPFSMEDNPAIVTAIKYGKIPYSVEGAELPEHLADLWLESVSKGTMHHYVEQILKIHQLSPHATKQLVTDIDYLCNVLDDLGLQASETVQHIISLLKASEEEYSDVSDVVPQRLASAICSMRNLTLE